MKKRIISFIALFALVAVLATCLIACNSYKWDSIGGGDSNAEVESNGGYFVRQGKYAYFINGYVGTDADNEWGKVKVQSIARAELDANGDLQFDENGNIKSLHIVVPKFIYNSNAGGGFAIYGDWIYYATPNYRKGNTGVASTTDTDFMRTKTDGSVTQLISRISTRSAQYMFTEKRILYYTSNTISYIDVSGMGNKSTDTGKGAVEGTLAENVSSVAWKYGCNTIFYTQTITGTDSYKHYNKLCSVDVDGNNARTLAEEKTFTTDPDNDPQHVFTYTLRDMFVESDNSVTIYYSKSYYDSAAKVLGLFMAKIQKNDETLDKVTEVQLNSLENASSTSALIYPLGYSKGALAYDSDNVYRYYKNEAGSAKDAIKVTEASQKIWFVDGDYAYYTAASSATTLLRIKYTELSTAEVVLTEGIKVDWLNLEFVPYSKDGKDRLDFYFFATDDENYMHTIDIRTFKDDNKDGEDGERKGSTYLGFEREEKDESAEA